MPTVEKPRLMGLDVLRCVAVVLVMIHHTPHLPPDAGSSPLRTAFEFIQRTGWCGVDLFFVLSGFLVSGLIFAEHRAVGSVRLGRFLIRRGLKIYPTFYVRLLVFILAGLLRGRDPHARSMLVEAAFVQNYGHGVWPHTWTLAVEEHFYIAVGVLLFGLQRLRRDRPFAPIPWLCGAILALVLALRVVTALGTPDLAEAFRPTHLRADSLVFGLLLSYLYHRAPESFAAWVGARIRPLLALGLLLVLPTWFVARESVFQFTAGYTLLYLGFGLIVLVFRFGPAPRGILGGLGTAAALVGRFSYPIYLFNVDMLYEGAERLPPLLGVQGECARWGLVAASFAILSLTFGMVASTLVEQPVLRLRDRIFGAVA
jgi:peptidoglycan/LPS O-acetylase OafA/YrhL